MNLISKSVNVAVVALTLSACSTTDAPPKPADPAKVYRISYRQSPPQPVYNRLRWVHLPDVVPGKIESEGQAARINPVIHYEVKNSTLSEAAKVLASVPRYRSYCSSIVADKRITMNTLGTIEELAEAIEQKAGIRVVVDHSDRSIRFLAQDTERPQFLEESKGS